MNRNATRTAAGVVAVIISLTAMPADALASGQVRASDIGSHVASPIANGPATWTQPVRFTHGWQECYYMVQGAYEKHNGDHLLWDSRLWLDFSLNVDLLCGDV